MGERPAPAVRCASQSRKARALAHRRIPDRLGLGIPRAFPACVLSRLWEKACSGGSLADVGRIRLGSRLSWPNGSPTERRMTPSPMTSSTRR